MYRWWCDILYRQIHRANVVKPGNHTGIDLVYTTVVTTGMGAITALVPLFYSYCISYCS